ncbi:amino acid/amide ABC transporter membrane protein 2, HAAT family /amino acid/amide ABC transporter ATP-binding protein 1, HAAT family [Desulfacinum infernum DSM 9756]|uniref:Amino acid/amide ABC transporter membrane protein 2, HAAT family /amino acid/amide ABC transporter ATP-binding protein 1, HAAT family n=1 Tax=Desulfacinum infernum DSM 9756 TaxID=1121391 RepID=A0A1M4SNW7_9BACT|nr:branched-chain amino acid ABC transporter ATP-binding protein/permease [Desulfacinum infernum]SHE33885.1 amino acid/amide ABC transporter membrane protein 2, HAAT family /amino acid/amide ABC transporter ATP-binding protein 1, HAAT family [Desulfacinum infernum DSM 9756]
MTERLPFVPKDWKPLTAVAAFAAVLPLVLPNDYFLVLFNIMALNALVVLGLNFLIGCAGQISLGHAAFYGLGAYTSAIVTTTLGWPLWAGLAAALATAALLGFLLAVPTLRLEGHYLVMATLGFNIIVSICLNQMEELTGGPSGFPGIPALHVGPLVIDTDRSFYGFIWTAFFFVFALFLNLEESRIGRALRAIHDKELTARTLGVPTHAYKVGVFVLSTVLAAFAGFCYAHYVTFISPKTFDIFYSVQVVTMVVVGGMGNLWGGLVGTALLTSLPELLHRFEDLHVLIYGLLLMGSLVFFPNGLAPAAATGLRELFRRLGGTASEKEERRTQSGPPGAKPARRVAGKPISQPDSESPPDRDVLAVRNISVRFGGLQALQNVSFTVKPGQIAALIGPNGAGKTTLLNVVSGLVAPQEGRIVAGDRDITGLPAHRVARARIGRSFQTVQMFSHLSVLDNLLLGFHLSGRAGFWRALWHTPAERREEETLRDLARAALRGTPLESKEDLPAAVLSLYEQKVLEILRALALEPRILLLDEPVGGLNPNESRRLMDWIGARRKDGMAMVLVEHDMNVVMEYADHVVVLQHGQVIAQGPPRKIQKDPKVIAAYLGTGRRAGRTEARSGIEETAC